MKRVKPLKIVLIILSITFSLIISGALLVLNYYPKHEVLKLITEHAEKALKRRVAINKLTYSIEGVVLNDISIYNGLSPEDDVLFSVENASIRFLILPLINKELIINKISLNNLKLNINYNNGKFNLADLFSDLKVNGKSSVSAKISRITLRDAEINVQSAPEFLKSFEGEYIFNGTIRIITKSRFHISDCKIKLPEKRGIMYPDMSIAVLDNNFEINSDVRLEKCSFLWVYKLADNLSLPFVDFTGKVKNLIVTKTSLEGSAEGVSTLTNLKSLHVKGSWRANIPRRKVTLYNLSGKINNSKFIVNNFQFNTKGIKYRFNITDIDVNVNDLKPILTFLPTRLYGRVTGNISLENRLYNGTFNLKNIGYNKKAGAISNINTDIIIKNNSFYKENFQALIYSQPCLVSIATTDNNFKKIALNITAKEFHFKHNGDSFSEYKDSSNELGFKISGRIDIDNLFIEKYNFSNFSLNYSLFQRNLVIERIMSKFMGGNVNAKGSFDIFKDNPDARFSISFKKIKVHNLARLSEKYNGRLFGVATGEANFKFKISRNSSISDSLSGNMKFFIDKGKIVNTGIQKGLGIWLSELEYKLKDLEFDKIYGNFRLTGRDYYINSFLFNAPDIKLKLDGYFSRMTQDDTKLPGDIKIGLEFNKNFIKDVPNITRAFTRLSLTKRGKLYTKSFRAYGDDVTDSKNIKPL